MSMFNKRPMNAAQSAAMLQLFSDLGVSEARAKNLLASGFLADLAHPAAQFIDRDAFRKSIGLDTTVEGTYRFTVNWDMSLEEIYQENDALTWLLGPPTFKDPAWAEGEVEYEFLIHQLDEVVGLSKLKAYGRGLDLGRPWKPASFRHAYALITQGWEMVSADLLREYYHALAFRLLFPGTTKRQYDFPEADVVDVARHSAKEKASISWNRGSQIGRAVKKRYAEERGVPFFVVFVRPVYKP